MTTLLARRRRERAARALSAWKARGPGNPAASAAFFLTQRVQSLLNGGSLDNPYSEHVWVYRAVAVCAQNLAGVPLRLYTGEDEDPNEQTSGPWYDLFTRPNPMLDRTRIWELTWTYLLLPPGDVFWLLTDQNSEPIGSPGAIPRYVWPSSGKRWREKKVDGKLAAWEYDDGRHKRTIETWQVLHLALANPENPYRGQSPLEAAMRSVRTDHKAMLWNEALLDNNAEPGVVIKLPGKSPQQVPQITKAWEDRLRGPGNNGKPVVLTGEKDDVIRTAYTHTEMGYQAQREWSRQEVAAAYGVPLFLLTVLGDVHRETSREAMKLFRDNTLTPLLRLAEGAMEAQLFLGRRGAGREMAAIVGNEVAVWGEFDTGAWKVKDDDEKRDIAAKDMALGIPLNQVIERLDLQYEAQEFGDVPLIGLGWQRLEDVVAEPEPVPDVLAPFAGPGPNPPAENEPEGDEEEPAEPEEDSDEDAEEEPRAVAFIGSRKRRLGREMAWRRYVQTVLDPHERRFKGRMRSYFFARRAEILNALRRMDERGTDWLKREVSQAEIEHFLDTAQARWDATLRDMTKPLHLATMEASLSRLSQQIGGLTQINMESPEILRVLTERQQVIVTVNRTMNKAVRFSIAQGLADGEGLTSLEARIKDIGKTLTSSSAARIARTEVGSASTGARFAGYEVEGVAKHSWLTAGDELVRESCAMCDGEVRGIGETFPNGLRYPLDEAAGDPSLVINCRCDTLPEVD